ncbi:target of rapamycin complex 2 subunit MAPKAP1-like isoform X2 [Lineus longissimus]|uniref:target of rapamycin complex 2 subunit MAPKAP1-like isoform X2 n=1 Tax=Lineus longissimus TaxID=88925 RepID=UPI002B4D4FA4
MAMTDNLSFLVTHIRKSFITSDDTQMCELIIENEDVSEKDWDPVAKRWKMITKHQPGQNPELAQSFDIVPDMDFGAHRRRSNTLMRLDRMKRDKQAKRDIKHIQWKNNKVEMTDDDITEMFGKREIRKKDTKRTSSLSEQLETSISIPDNPFKDYARFDGRNYPSIQVKKIGIFLTMLDEDERAFPMVVVVLSTSKVIELIGLICWQYNNENRKPKLKEDLDIYDLYIAEDDGEVDNDFPAIDKREPISKFGFTRMALVEKVQPSTPKDYIFVTVNMPGKGSTKIQVENQSIKMKEILAKVVKRRVGTKTKGLDYNLEKQSEAGVPVDLELSLNAMDTLEFCLLRENSKRGDIPDSNVELEPSMLESLGSFQYKTYRASMPQKLFSRSKEVQLGISREQIEIDPVSNRKAANQKAYTYDMDAIAACDMLDEKSTGKGLFRLVFQQTNGKFDHHDFEADVSTAKEIVSKVGSILEFISSRARKDYLSEKSKKKNRKSFYLDT